MKKSLVMVLVLIVTCMSFIGCSKEEEVYPSEDITVIIPFGNGGGTDIAGRFFITALDEQLDVNVVPKNVAGTAGVVGAKELYNSEADGYTLMIAPASYPVAHIMGKIDMTYEDYKPVVQFSQTNMGLFVQADSPYNTVDDLVNAAKDNPGEIKFGVSMGTLLHFATLGFEDHYGVTYNKVAIGGATPVIPELQSGRVEAYFSSVSQSKHMVDSGDFRLLAIYGDERNNVVPDVPTLAELGSPYNFTQTFGLWAPKDTPQEIIDAIVVASQKATSDEGFVESMTGLGHNVKFMEPDEYNTSLEAAYGESDAVKDLLDVE